MPKIFNFTGELQENGSRVITEQNIANQSVNKADTADKLTEARTIELTGDATGSATFDGSGDVTIDVTISELSDHIDDGTHVTADEKTAWNAAKDHADSEHAPANAEANQNAFSNVKVGETTVSAGSKTDTIEFEAGDNIEITPDAENKKVTIKNTYSYTHPTVEHLPTGGSNGQVLKRNSDGAAVWADETDTNTTYENATTSAAGLMSSADKTKLDGIESGANNYVHPTVEHLPTGGSNGQVLKRNSDGAAVWANETDTTYENATTSAAGLMSSDDKTKLDGIASGANNYTHPTTSGNKHIPTGGSEGQILKWKSSGEAQWADVDKVEYENSTTSSDGLMSKEDKTKLDGIDDTIDDAITTHDTDEDAHSDIRLLISELTEELNAFLDVDDDTRDQLSEVLDLIDANAGTIESITSNKVNVSDIVDNLTTSNATKVLSAKQGVVLKGLIDALETALAGKVGVEFSTTDPKMDGTASVGSVTTVSRSDHVHPTDTSRAAKEDLDAHIGNSAHVTAAEKTAWNAAKDHADSDHAPANAEANQDAFSNIKVGSTTITAGSETATIELVAGDNIEITPDNTDKKVTIKNTYSYTHPTANHIPTGGSEGQILKWKSTGEAQWADETDTNTTYEKATTSSDGLMSKEDKTKLDDIEEGANRTTIDTELDSESSNPVENKVIAKELSDIRAYIDASALTRPAARFIMWGDDE